MTITAKPIPFSAPMVQATLREIEAPGTGKTQTRRFMKIMGHKSITEFGPSDTKGYDWHFRDKEMRFHDFRHDELMKLSPYQVGELRYVREHWRTWVDRDPLPPREMHPEHCPVFYEVDRDNCARHGRFRHGMHMPRWASRITLEITDVRVERLQDMDGQAPYQGESDALAEGIHRIHHGDGAYYYSAFRDEPDGQNWCDPTDAFRELWESINGPESWDANPWVWAVSFKPHLINVDQFIKERAAA